MTGQSILRIIPVLLDLVRIYYIVEEATQTNSVTNYAKQHFTFRVYIINNRLI